MSAPHTNVGPRLFVSPFTYTTLPPGLLQIYIYSQCGHSEMRCQGHHCHFNCLSIYMCTKADAAVYAAAWSDCARFQKPSVGPMQRRRLLRWSWLVATSPTVQQASGDGCVAAATLHPPSASTPRSAGGAHSGDPGAGGRKDEGNETCSSH